MRVHLQREIDRLKQQLLALSAEVEDDTREAVRALENRDMVRAGTVLRRETQTNAMEVNVEEECLKILALHQPVASDLRYIVAVLKINQALERIGDLAVHIAERTLELCGHPAVELPFRIGPMAALVQAMLRKVIGAFVAGDVRAAHEVCAADAEVDALRREINAAVGLAVRATPEHFEPYVQVMHIARHLERIADHATNIAEDLIYLVEGRIVRHTAEVSDKPALAADAGRRLQ